MGRIRSPASEDAMTAIEAGDGRKRAVLYRMVTPEHTCPYGVKARALLRRKGYQVEDHHLTDRAATDAFKAEHGVKTTPQTFIGGARVGGYDDLRRFFGLKVKDANATSYTPVIVVFAVAALVSLAVGRIAGEPLAGAALVERFIAAAMMLLAMLKLQDVDRFATMFLNYDLLAKRVVPYAYAYPFLELGAGTLMLAGVLGWLSIPVALFIGGIGAVSVFKAVYVDRRELKCACVGGNSNVPLGFVSLTENLMMIAMAVWMLAAA
jgi:glutaredoxin